MASMAKWFPVMCRLGDFIRTPTGLQYSPVQQNVLANWNMLDYVLISVACVFVETYWHQLPLIIIPVRQKPSSTILLIIMRGMYKELDTHMPDKQLPVADSSMACSPCEATFLIPGKPRESLISVENETWAEQHKQRWLGKGSLQWASKWGGTCWATSRRQYKDRAAFNN